AHCYHHLQDPLVLRMRAPKMEARFQWTNSFPRSDARAVIMTPMQPGLNRCTETPRANLSTARALIFSCAPEGSSSPVIARVVILRLRSSQARLQRIIPDSKRLLRR